MTARAAKAAAHAASPIPVTKEFNRAIAPTGTALLAFVPLRDKRNRAVLSIQSAATLNARRLIRYACAHCYRRCKPKGRGGKDNNRH